MKFDARSLEFCFGVEVRQQFQDECAVVGRLHFGDSAFLPLVKIKDVADHVVDAFDLFFDARLRLGTDFGADAWHIENFRGKADDVQRIFQIVNDALREAADDGEIFGLNQFMEMALVEFAEAMADFLQEVEREAGRMLRATPASLRAG